MCICYWFNGNVICEEPLNGPRWLGTYNEQNRLVYESTPGIEKTYYYEDNKLIKETTITNDSTTEKDYTYDDKGNLVYTKNSDGEEEWFKYDSGNKEIYYKNSNDYERWTSYLPNWDKSVKDSNNEFEEYEYCEGQDGIMLLKHFKDNFHDEYFEYDSKDNVIHYKDKDKEYVYENLYDDKGVIKRIERYAVIDMSQYMFTKNVISNDKKKYGKTEI